MSMGLKLLPKRRSGFLKYQKQLLKYLSIAQNDSKAQVLEKNHLLIRSQTLFKLLKQRDYKCCFYRNRGQVKK